MLVIERMVYQKRLEQGLDANSIVALLGPRQCGKTTLARRVAEGRKAVFFDLEKPSDRARLADPELALSHLTGLVVIDEIQRLPDLFPVLRPLADRTGRPATFLLLGSASPEIVKGVSESLAGRIGFVDLGGFTLQEVGVGHLRTLWQRGSFPRSYLARNEAESVAWREDFVRTFLERDLPQLGIRVPSDTLRRFWMMVAHYHGELWNASEMGRSLGMSETAVRRHLDILTGAYMIRQLPPWWENLGKRQYKSPKIYLRDSGLFHRLLAIDSAGQLETHPKLGASWEGFALEQVLARVGDRQAFFWRTHAGAELDLLFFRGGRRYGVEFKFSSAPAMTKSLYAALADLKLERAWIVHSGDTTFPIHDRVEALSIRDLERLA